MQEELVKKAAQIEAQFQQIDTFQMNLVTWRQEIDFLKLVKSGLENDFNEKTRLTEKL